MSTVPRPNKLHIDQAVTATQCARMWGRAVVSACIAALGAATWACEAEYRQYVAPSRAAPVAPDAGGRAEGAPRPAAGDESSAFLNEATPRDAGIQSTGVTPEGTQPTVCIPSGARDCTSERDNDCDGQPDNVIDGICRCVRGSAEPCDEHAGLDGVGQCRAGSRSCVLGQENATSDWGVCEGAIGPETDDSCTIAGDDSETATALPTAAAPAWRDRRLRAVPARTTASASAALAGVPTVSSARVKEPYFRHLATVLRRSTTTAMAALTTPSTTSARVRSVTRRSVVSTPARMAPGAALQGDGVASQARGARLADSGPAWEPSDRRRKTRALS